MHEPVLVIDETGEASVEMENCSAKDVIRALTLRWLPYCGRPKLALEDVSSLDSG